MSKYAAFGTDQLEEHLSNFLINSWSYSRVSQFARHEKVFEMIYIYGLFGKNSATTVAGQAYHEALEYYFAQFKEGVAVDVVEMEKAAFEHIDNIKSNQWKLQKTTPTVEDCIQKANTTASVLIRNFFSEKALIEDEIGEVLDVEIFGTEWLTVNGVEIPLPCNFRIDLVIKTKSGKVVIVDHKSKAIYSDESEMILVNGNQAITYVSGYESKTGITVDEVWFIENKISQNKDKSPQLRKFELTIDDNTRKLFELQLYEPLKRMISAVSDPDYTYLINYSDNYVDRAELYDFWARTMICEVEDFNVEETKKELVSKRLKKIRDSSVAMINPQVIKNFKENADKFIQYDLSNKNMTQEQKIEHVLRSFGTIVRVAHKFEGYSSATYLLEISAGVKVSSIQPHRLDIANALDVPNVRVGKELTVYEGRSYLPIDFSKKRDGVLYFDSEELKGLRIPLGKDNFNNTVFWDLENHSTPHILTCGATGSGKTVFLKSTVEYCLKAGVKNIVIIDPKFKDFKSYKKRKGVTVVNEIEEIEETVENLVEDMNMRAKSGIEYITLIVIDELADAIANSKKGKELDIMEMVEVGRYAPKKDSFGFVMDGAPKMALKKVGEKKSFEENLQLLLQKGRALGYRIIGGTQRASTKIINGDAKANFPVQVCFRVPKETDSRVVIDEPGAESLSGYGDGLIKSPEYMDVVRFQAYYFQPVIIAEHDTELNTTIIQ